MLILAAGARVYTRNASAPSRRGRVDTPRRQCHIGAELKAANEAWLPAYMAGSLAEGNPPMAMDAATIERLIKEGLPDAQSRSRICAATATTTPPCRLRRVSSGKSRVQQHQMVYQALRGRMGNELHALALQTSAPE
jgi:hypothetical protein